MVSWLWGIIWKWWLYWMGKDDFSCEHHLMLIFGRFTFSFLFLFFSLVLICHYLIIFYFIRTVTDLEIIIIYIWCTSWFSRDKTLSLCITSWSYRNLCDAEHEYWTNDHQLAVVTGFLMITPHWASSGLSADWVLHMAMCVCCPPPVIGNGPTWLYSFHTVLH